MKRPSMDPTTFSVHNNDPAMDPILPAVCVNDPAWIRSVATQQWSSMYLILPAVPNHGPPIQNYQLYPTMQDPIHPTMI